MSELRLAGVIKESIVDGPGIRYVVFTQGCAHECKGCHNPATHSFDKGYVVDTSEVVSDILKHKYIDGVTLSGGDPMYQAKACTEIVEILKNRGINVICYTGFTYEQILSSGNEHQINLLKKVDVLVDGPFIEEEKDLRLAFKGSRNQRIIDVQRSLASGMIIPYDIGQNSTGYEETPRLNVLAAV